MGLQQVGLSQFLGYWRRVAADAARRAWADGVGSIRAAAFHVAVVLATVLVLQYPAQVEPEVQVILATAGAIGLVVVATLILHIFAVPAQWDLELRKRLGDEELARTLLSERPPLTVEVTPQPPQIPLCDLSVTARGRWIEAERQRLQAPSTRRSRAAAVMDEAAAATVETFLSDSVAAWESVVPLIAAMRLGAALTVRVTNQSQTRLGGVRVRILPGAGWIAAADAEPLRLPSPPYAHRIGSLGHLLGGGAKTPEQTALGPTVAQVVGHSVCWGPFEIEEHATVTLSGVHLAARQPSTEEPIRWSATATGFPAEAVGDFSLAPLVVVSDDQLHTALAAARES